MILNRTLSQEEPVPFFSCTMPRQINIWYLKTENLFHLQYQKQSLCNPLNYKSHYPQTPSPTKTWAYRLAAIIRSIHSHSLWRYDSKGFIHNTPMYYILTEIYKFTRVLAVQISQAVFCFYIQRNEGNMHTCGVKAESSCWCRYQNAALLLLYRL